MRRLAALVALSLILTASASAAAPKLSERLREVSAPGGPATPAGVPAGGPGSLVRYGDRYLADIRTGGTAPALIERLRAAGADIHDVSARYGVVVAAIAPDDLAAVAQVAGVKSVTEDLAGATGGTGVTGAAEARRATCPTGVVSEGDSQLRAAIARSTYSVDGTGVKVGVLSDSFNTSGNGSAAADIASGDLPGAANPCGHATPVQVVEEKPAGGNTPVDEGRAMLQIVHDLAPGAQLAFATAAEGSQTEYANNIIALKDAGAKVIIDDYIYFAEPFFQDGPIANAVRQVTQAGVTYVTMAYNNAQRLAGADVGSFEAPAYRPTACPAGLAVPAGSDCMDFDPGPASDPTFQYTGSAVKIVLQWAEPWGGVTSDFDLYLLDGTTVSASSTTVNTTTQVPFESAASAGTRDVVIVRKPGVTGTPRIKFVVNNNGAQVTAAEYTAGAGGDVIGPVIYGHNGTATAQTVGAISYASTTAPEVFSGRGPTTHYFGPVAGPGPAAALAQPEVLSKPDITATDRGINTFFGTGNRFSGTSAAAPHAAAVAALQLQATPALTPAQVKADQVGSGTPIGNFGPFAIGSGLLDAATAVDFARTPTTVTASVPPAAIAPSATFAASRAATFTCAVDGGAAGACTSPFALPVATDGSHTLQVAATDRAGRTATSPALPFVRDTTGPLATISGGPRGATNLRRPVFAFSPGETGATAQCSFDGAPFAVCASPASPPADLADGAHGFSVRGADALGNLGAPAQAGYTVDATKPVLKFKKKPKQRSKTRKGTFKIATSEPLAKLECKLDKGAFKTCKPTKKVKVKPGKHSLTVRGIDAAGNVSKAVTFTWKVKRKRR